MNYKLLVLVGPKGSGKSHIGRELEALFQIKYVRIEAVWQELKKRRADFLSPDYIREGRHLTLDLIRSHLKDRHVCIEASGVADDWDEYVTNLKSMADVIFIKVICSLDECKKRALGRDQSLQVQISDDLFDQINEKAAHIELDWAGIINNEPFISPDELRAVIGPILMTYTGIIISESLNDPAIIQRLHVLSTEVARDPNTPGAQWHLYKVQVNKDDVQAIADCLKPAGFYAHFGNTTQGLVAFPSKVFKLDPRDSETWVDAIVHGRNLGIPEQQLDFSFDDFLNE